MQQSYKESFILDDDVTYLNCANMSPMLRSVKAAGLVALETRAAPWKLSTGDWFNNAEILRDLAAKIFQTSPHNVALIPSASYGLALAAKNLRPAKGKTIIVLENQFPSNFYVWQDLAAKLDLKIQIISQTNAQSLTESILEAIDENTGIVTIPNCHWITGTWIDLEKISASTKSNGAYLVLDLSQSLGVLPIDIEKIQPDFAVAVGYKWMLGPYSLGYLYVSPKWQDKGEPLEYSWFSRDGSENFATLTQYTKAFRPGARKFDMGEVSQFHLLPMAIAGLKQILDWKIDFIQNQIQKLTQKIVEYKIHSGILHKSESHAGHIISLPVSNQNQESLNKFLQTKKIFISFRGASIRISPHLYNDHEEIENLLSFFYKKNR